MFYYRRIVIHCKIKNLTSHNFSNAELVILDCGLYYALDKCTVDTSKLLASVEPAVSKLKNKHSICTGISKTLLKTNISVSSDFNSELNMLKNLTKDPLVVVPRADKAE